MNNAEPRDQECIVQRDKTNLKQTKRYKWKPKEHRLGIHQLLYKTGVGSGAPKG